MSKQVMTNLIAVTLVFLVAYLLALVVRYPLLMGCPFILATPSSHPV
jgi:hypothetical protein